MKHIIFSFIFLAAASAAYASSPKKSSVIPTSKVMTHDPVLAKLGDTYYLFATGQGISVMSSKDLQNWKFEKPVFEEAPQWAVETVKGYNGHTWAPDIIFHNGLYHCFIHVRHLERILPLSVMLRILHLILPVLISSGQTMEK